MCGGRTSRVDDRGTDAREGGHLGHDARQVSLVQTKESEDEGEAERRVGQREHRLLREDHAQVALVGQEQSRRGSG